MTKKPVQTDSVAQTKKPYAQGIEVTGGRMVYTSGLIARDVDGKLVALGDIRGQTRQCLENIDGIFKAAGGSLRDMVKMTVFIVDLDDYDGMNEIRNEMLGDIDFASSTVKVGLNAREALIEIEAVAAIGT